MKPPQDPPRLLDPGSDAPGWLRGPLEAGARDLARPSQLARIAARLPKGPGPTPLQPPAPPVAPSLPSMFSGAAIGAALGLAVVGMGWVASPRAGDARPPAPAAPIATVGLPVPEPPRPAPSTSPAPRPRPPHERSEPLPSGTVAPVAPVGTEPAAPVSTGSESEPPAAEPESESEILRRAQDALRGSPARALALTDRHLARFPGGTFAQEREVLAISALLGMGRTAAARARATRFLTSFPTSAHRRRLEVLIPDLESSAGDHKDSSDPPSTP